MIMNGIIEAKSAHLLGRSESVNAESVKTQSRRVSRRAGEVRRSGAPRQREDRFATRSGPAWSRGRESPARGRHGAPVSAFALASPCASALSDRSRVLTVDRRPRRHSSQVS